MTRLLVIIAACAAALGPVVTACSAGSGGQAADAAKLQPIVDAWAERHDMSVLAVSMMSPSGSVTTVGYSAEGEGPDGRALFIIGSLGKTMMAATTLLLVEEGVLDLDEPIDGWLPDFPRADEITLRQLLSHTAGLHEQLPGSDLTPGPAALAALSQTRTPTELLAEAANSVEDERLPATYRYSTAGYWVVGAVIESAVGASLAEVMRAQVFEPLGMDDTYLAWPEAIDQRLVGGELTLPDGAVIPLGTEIIPATMSQGWGPGGLLSTSRDVATFYGAVFEDLLAPSSVEAMTTTVPDSGDYGLGIDTAQWPSGITGWEHGGLAVGYSSAAGITDDGWSVAVLTNHFDLASGGRELNLEDLNGELLQAVGAET